jgi:hypothetical protein
MPKRTERSRDTGDQKARTPRTFVEVVDLAETDPAYAQKLKQIAKRAKTAEPTAVNEFLKEFRLTPSVLKAFEPKVPANRFLTSVPCLFTVGVATCYLSCFKKTMRGYHWFCKEAGGKPKQRRKEKKRG